MINEVKRIFDDIRDAIIEMGGNIDICTSPDDYDSAIKSLAGNNAVLFVPVFKSSDVKPDRPTTQMSSNNPTSYPDGWSTPDGLVDNIWMTYTIVGPETVYVNWTEPLLVHSTGEQGGEGLPKGMTRTFLIYAEYPSRNVTLSRPQGGHWDAENNLLTGNITSVVTPDNSETTDTVLWYPDNNHEPGLFTWLSSGTFRADTGELLGQWSEPICITAKDGENGRNGADGTEQEYIYKLLSSTSEISRLERPYSDPDVDDYVPTGWTDSPLAIDPDIYPVEVMCSRVKNKVDKKWGLFSMPIPWAVWGQDGTDGDGVEYIFLIASPDQCQQHEDGSWELTDSTVFPPLNEAQYLAQTRETGISDELALQAYQNDEFVPGDNALAQSLNWDRNWTDDPSDVSENEPLEFVSIRKYRKVPLTNESEWGWYSVPKLWNKWAYVDASIFTAFAFTRTNENLAALNPALVIEGGSDNNPIPDPSQYTKDGVTHTVTWYDSIPAGNGTVWMTQRVFGQPNSTWSSARKMADTDRFQVEYSNSSEVTVNTQLPTLNDYVTDANPEGVDETAWRTYCNNNNLGVWNDDNSVVNPLWMATCNKVNGVWSSWHIARIRGENSVRIDFTNDKDELIYDTYGNKVSNRNVSTTAMLYDGSTQVTSNVTWRFYSVSGVDIPSGQNAIASFPAPAQLGASAAYIRTDGEILVTGIKSNANEAVLVVEATYNGAQYYKQFWVGKIVGQDNYYLDFTPNVIVYNTTTGNPSTITLNVKVMKESYVDGSISVAPAMPSGYKVFLYDGNTIDVNWTDVDKNYSLSMSNSIQDLQLLLATAKTGGTVEDGPEDILVNFVANGENGTPGTPGAPGRGIVSIITYYMWSADGINHPAENASGWNATIPTFSPNTPYLWCKIVTTYTSGNPDITYSVSRQGSDGNPGSNGAKLRMRNWSATAYSSPDSEGQNGWLSGNSTDPDYNNDAFYDIAIWPINANSITIENAASNAPRLWLCKKRLTYAKVAELVQANGADNVYPGSVLLNDYFVQAQGWDFLATNVLLANKINANDIFSENLSVNQLHTTGDDGHIDIMGNDIALSTSSGAKGCLITGDALTEIENYSGNNGVEQIVWKSPFGLSEANSINTMGFEGDVQVGSFSIDSLNSGESYALTFENGLGNGLAVQLYLLTNATSTVTPWSMSGTLVTGMYVKEASSGRIVANNICNNINNNVVLTEQNAHSENEREVVLYSNDDVLYVYQNNNLLENYSLNVGNYILCLNYRLELYPSDFPSGSLPSRGCILQTSHAPLKLTKVSSGSGTVTAEDVQFTEIGANGFQHILDQNNYFRVITETDVNDNKTLKLEFLSNGTYGLQITKDGIKYRNGNSWSNWTTP